MKEKSKKLLKTAFVYTLTIIIFIALGYLFYTTMSIPLKSIFENMNIRLKINFLLSLFLVYILFLVFNNLNPVLKVVFKKELKKYFLMTIFVMLAFLIIGWSYIDYSFGKQNLNLVLRDAKNSNTIRGNINCKDDAGNLLIWNTIRCEMKPSLSNISAFVIFRYENDKEVKLDIAPSLTFLAPENVKYISFRIQGINEDNERLSLDVGYPFKFFTKEEIKSREENYLKYLLALIGIILFSVPPMMINFRKIWLDNIT
ncbi:hypothetical protein JXB41_04430 [Candidatus Woesearchaeota archaeon]|nr:hypothetical protein [Candidatus Woesearchaeota archaeon]